MITKWTEITIETSSSNYDILLANIYSLVDLSGLNEKINTNNIELVIYTKTQEKDLSFFLNKIKYLTNNIKIKSFAYDSSNETEWKKYFKPQNIGNIVIKPSWEKYNGDGIIVTIDPGTAFGTGLHGTTKGVIMLLQDIEKKDHVLDAGTGSGILSIIASKLGHNHILAIDNDIEAVNVAKDNIQINAIKNIDVQLGSLEAINQKFDLIIANIISEVLIENVKKFSNILNKNGILILSGILKTEKDKVINHFNKYFTFDNSIDLDEWTSLKFLYKNLT